MFDEQCLNKTMHLAPGIWAAAGDYGGMVIQAVLLVQVPSCRPRLNMGRVAESVGVQDYLDRRVRFRIREAAGV